MECKLRYRTQDEVLSVARQYKEETTQSIWKGLCYSGNPILEAAFIDAGALYFILRNSRGVTPVAFLNMAIKWLASVNPVLAAIC